LLPEIIGLKHKYLNIFVSYIYRPENNEIITLLPLFNLNFFPVFGINAADHAFKNDRSSPQDESEVDLEE